MATIESNDLNLSEVFKDFYSVPDYQREYVWSEEEVEQLLTDIRDEQRDGEKADYFIGSIVTCPGDHGRLDLIDGQQRLTTIFIALCAIRDRLKLLGDTKLGSITRLIADEKTDAKGQDSFEVRLLLQYSDAGDILDVLTGGTELPVGTATRSIANIVTAYQTATEFFVSKYEDNIEELRGFYGYLINNVKLIRIRTDSLARALKIFETINDRGIGLDAMDLLKNLLFRRAKNTEFDNLKTSWKSLVDSLYAAKEKPLRFLRYYIISTYGIDKLREDQLYDWLVDNEKLIGFGSRPTRFVEELNNAVAAYLNFLSGRTADGNREPSIESLALLSGKSTRQHLIVLLATREKSIDIFSAVCRDLEGLVFGYLIARQNNREFESLFPGWAVELVKVNTAVEYAAFANMTFVPRRKELATRFLRGFAELETRKLKKYQTRYIVAKLTQAVDMAGYGAAAEGNRWLSRYVDSANQVEHILPQNASEAAASEFGEDADNPITISQIGNLALAESSINGSLGNKSFSQKMKVYPKSQFLLTRSISQKVEIGKNTQIDRAVKQLSPFAEWTKDSVRERSSVLADLATKVWGMGS